VTVFSPPPGSGSRMVTVLALTFVAVLTFAAAFVAVLTFAAAFVAVLTFVAASGVAPVIPFGDDANATRTNFDARLR
jgi:hypothetical protein